MEKNAKIHAHFWREWENNAKIHTHFWREWEFTQIFSLLGHVPHKALKSLPKKNAPQFLDPSNLKTWKNLDPKLNKKLDPQQMLDPKN